MARRPEDEPAADKSKRAEPNLELPSFRLGRRKKKSNDSEAERATQAPVAKRPPAPPRAAPKPSAESGAPLPDANDAARKRRPPAPPKPDEVLVPKRVPAPPVVEKVPERPPAETGPPREQDALPTEIAPPPPPQRERERKVKEPKAAKPPKAAKEPKAKKEPRASKKRTTTPISWMPGWLGSILTGAGCGALTVVLAWATAQGCDAVRGVGTCGGFGVFALAAILGIDVIVASGLLRLFRVTDPTTTSVLGVGLVAVSAMLFFLKDTESRSMIYVIPILMAVTFALSWWVTQAIAQKVDD